MKPIHVMITISRSEDVYLPILLGEMSRDVSVPLRISVFLISPIFAPQVNEMAKIFAQIDNPMLTKAKGKAIECFSPEQPQKGSIDLLLAHSCDDLAHIHVKPRLTILHQLPGTNEAARLSRYHNWLMTPFEHIANIEIANCAHEIGLDPKNMSAIGCYASGKTFTIYAKRDFKAAGRSFKQFETVLEKALNTVFMHSLPQHITSLQAACSYLRSWRKEVSITFVFRGTDGEWLALSLKIVNGEPAIEDTDEDPDLRFATS